MKTIVALFLACFTTALFGQGPPIQRNDFTTNGNPSARGVVTNIVNGISALATNYPQSFSIDFAGMGNGVPGAAGFVDYRNRNWNILGVLSNDTRITNGYLEADMSLPSGRTAVYLYPSNGIPFPVTEIGIEYEHVWTNANTGFLAAMNMSLSTNPMAVAGEINWSVGFHITIAFQTITVDLLTNGLGSSVTLGTFNVDNGFQISNFGQRKHLRLIFPGNNTIQCVGDGFWGSITNSRIEQFRATGTNKTYAYWEWGNFSGSSVPFYTFRTYSVWANNQLEYEGGTPLPLYYGRNANNYLSRSNTTANLGIISPTLDAITEFQFYAGYATPVFKANSSGFFPIAAGVTGTSTGMIGQFKFVKPLAATASRVLMNGADGIATNVTSATPSTTYLHPDGTEGSPSGSGIPVLDGTGTNLSASYFTGVTNSPLVARGTNGVPMWWVLTNRLGVVGTAQGTSTVNSAQQIYDPGTGRFQILVSNNAPVLTILGGVSVGIGTTNPAGVGLDVPGTIWTGTVQPTNANVINTITGATVNATSGNFTGTATGATLRATSGQITGTSTQGIMQATTANVSGTVTGATVTAASGNFSGTITGATLNVTTGNHTGTSTGATVQATTLIADRAITHGRTNATGTAVTADWNGPRRLRLDLSGTTTISFTNCPAANGNWAEFILELYATTTVPATTIANVDSRAINFGKRGLQLVNGETNFVQIIFDGTNFIGSCWQDLTTGSGPYMLQTQAVFTAATTLSGIAETNTTLAGVGGANTNFTGQANDAVVYIDAGTTNVNFVAIMPGAVGLTYTPCYILSNLTTTARQFSFSSVTNQLFPLQQYDGITLPITITNKHRAILSVMITSTQTFWALKQCTNGF